MNQAVARRRTEDETDSGFTIRPYRAVADVLEVMAMCEEMHADSPYADWPLNEDKLMALFTASVHRPEWYFCAVAEVAGKPVGMCLGGIQEFYWASRRFAHNILLYVRKPYRRGGVAKVLVRRFESWAAANGVSEIQLGATSGRATGRLMKWFGRLGYRRMAAMAAKRV